jgi:very-short-patch-repair endonuclease
VFRGTTRPTGMSKAKMLAKADPVHARMAAYAALRHGIVHTDELLRAGIPRSTIGHWARSGLLFRLHRGVFSVIPPSMLSPEGRWLAAVRRCGPGAFLSHGPSLQLQGILDRRTRYAVHVSLADRSPRRPPGILVHRPRDLPSRDTLTFDGVPTTSITRAIWDSAATLPPQPIRTAYEKAARLDKLDRPRLIALADSHPNRKGSGFVRQLISEKPLPAAEVRSWLEELIWETCTLHRLPLPAINVPLLGYEADFLWERQRFVVEADGGDHLTPTQRDKDNRRDFELGRAGFLVRRYSSRDMARREAVVGEILLALGG